MLISKYVCLCCTYVVVFNLFLNEAHHLIFVATLTCDLFQINCTIRCQRERVEVVVEKEEEGEGKAKEEREVS